MFDIAPSRPDPDATAPVLCLSAPYGVTREWEGIAGCLGSRDVRAFEDDAAFRIAVSEAPQGAHLVAWGTAGHTALELASAMAGRVRSVTLVDPDIMAALPDFSVMPVHRPAAQMRRQVTGYAATGDLAAAAEAATDFVMGRGAFGRSSARLQGRFMMRTPRLVRAWKAQAQRPLALYRLAAQACPTLVVTGRTAPAEFREAARLLAYASPATRRAVIREAGACAHLTDPHEVGPEVRNFVAHADLVWQTSSREGVAA